MVGTPQVLLLDEPTSALDPVGRRVVRQLLEDLQRQGIAVLLNSHLLSEVELVCDRVAILREGRLVAGGAPRDLIKPHGLEVELAAGTRQFPGAQREDVPGIVAQLVADGEEVYGVRLLASTLEDVYLAAMGVEAESS
jgi:ABC-2 type transport system ATP-binding protein